MCCPCGFLCCGSDAFGGCGCDDCPDPRCFDRRPHDHPVAPPEDDDASDETPLPLAALSRVAVRFRCVEIA